MKSPVLKRFGLSSVIYSVHLLLFFNSALSSQDPSYPEPHEIKRLERALNRKLAGRVLLLRKPCKDDAGKLEFDRAGNLRSGYRPGEEASDRAFLFVRGRVENGSIELITEKLLFYKRRDEKTGATERRYLRLPGEMRLVRIIFPAGRKAMLEELERTLAGIFLTEEELDEI